MIEPFEVKPPKDHDERRAFGMPFHDWHWFMPNRRNNLGNEVVKTPFNLVLVLLLLSGVTKVAGAQPFVIVGEDNLESVDQLEASPLRTAFGAVLQVENTAEDVWICTAVRLTESLVMTNHHCDRDCPGLVFHGTDGSHTVRFPVSRADRK